MVISVNLRTSLVYKFQLVIVLLKVYIHFQFKPINVLLVLLVCDLCHAPYLSPPAVVNLAKIFVYLFSVQLLAALLS